MNPLTFVIVNLAVVALIHTGAMKVEVGILTQGMVIALYNYMSQILVELVKMANLIISMTKAAACADRVAKVMQMESDQKNGSHEANALRGEVEFRNVSARYAGAAEDSLEQI